MSDRTTRHGSTLALIVIVVALLMFSWLTVEVSYPTFEFVSSRLLRNLVPLEPFDGIAAQVSHFLWDHRALDLTGQAFVIVAAVICCLALLKPEEGEG